MRATRTELHTYVSLALAAHLAAYLLVGGVTGGYLAAFVVAFAVLIVVFWEVVRRLGGGKEAVELKRRLLEIQRLPKDKARRIAYAILNDGTKFRCVEAFGPLPTVTTLSPDVRDLFQKYERVEAVAGEAFLDRRGVAPSRLDPRFIVIGGDMEGTEVVVSDGGLIHEIDGTESAGMDLDSYPSIYHWLIAVTEALYPEPEKKM